MKKIIILILSFISFYSFSQTTKIPIYDSTGKQSGFGNGDTLNKDIIYQLSAPVDTTKIWRNTTDSNTIKFYDERQKIWKSVSNYVKVKDFMTAPTYRILTVSTSNGSATVTGNFAAADLNKQIVIDSAHSDGNAYVGYITAVSVGVSATVTATPNLTASNKIAYILNDVSAAFQAAVNKAISDPTYGNTVFVDFDKYSLLSTVTIPKGVNLVGNFSTGSTPENASLNFITGYISSGNGSLFEVGDTVSTVPINTFLASGLVFWNGRRGAGGVSGFDKAFVFRAQGEPNVTYIETALIQNNVFIRVNKSIYIQGKYSSNNITTSLTASGFHILNNRNSLGTYFLYVETGSHVSNFTFANNLLGQGSKIYGHFEGINTFRNNNHQGNNGSVTIDLKTLTGFFEIKDSYFEANEIVNSGSPTLNPVIKVSNWASRNGGKVVVRNISSDALPLLSSLGTYTNYFPNLVWVDRVEIDYPTNATNTIYNVNIYKEPNTLAYGTASKVNSDNGIVAGSNLNGGGYKIVLDGLSGSDSAMYVSILDAKQYVGQTLIDTVATTYTGKTTINLSSVSGLADRQYNTPFGRKTGIRILNNTSEKTIASVAGLTQGQLITFNVLFRIPSPTLSQPLNAIYFNSQGNQYVVNYKSNRGDWSLASVTVRVSTAGTVTLGCYRAGNSGANGDVEIAEVWYAYGNAWNLLNQSSSPRWYVQPYVTTTVDTTFKFNAANEVGLGQEPSSGVRLAISATTHSVAHQVVHTATSGTKYAGLFEVTGAPTTGIGFLSLVDPSSATTGIGMHVNVITGTNKVDFFAGNTSYPTGSWSMYIANGRNNYLGSGNTGFAQTLPQYLIDADAKTGKSGNPMRLQGVLQGSTSDSIATLSSGVMKQLSIAQVINAGVVTQTASPADGATVTIAATTTRLLLQPSSLLSTLTIAFPSSPTDGQKLRISVGSPGGIASGSAAVITTTWSNGTIYGTTPVSLTGGDTFDFQWDSANNIWRRIIL